MKRFKIASNYYQETQDGRGALMLILGINSKRRAWESYKWVQAYGEVKA